MFSIQVVLLFPPVLYLLIVSLRVEPFDPTLYRSNLFVTLSSVAQNILI